MPQLLVNDYKTTLSAALGGLATDLSLSLTDLPPVALRGAGNEYRLLIHNGANPPAEKEIVRVQASATGANPQTILERGVEGTARVAHASGSVVEQALSLGGLQTLLPTPLSSTPGRLGWEAMTCDPWHAAEDVNLSARLVAYLIPIDEARSFRYIEFMERTTAATGVTNAGIRAYYAEPGASLADPLHATVDIATAITTVGWKSFDVGALTAIPYRPGGILAVAIEVNATTRPSLRTRNQSISEFRTNGALGRATAKPAATYGNIAMPAQLDLAAGSVISGQAWIGLRQ